MKTNFARITVQNSFCVKCCDVIKSKVMEVPEVMNISLYPSQSLIVFNFKRANQVSEVLNTLVSLGYPPEHDTINENHQTLATCSCNLSL